MQTQMTTFDPSISRGIYQSPVKDLKPGLLVMTYWKSHYRISMIISITKHTEYDYMIIIVNELHGSPAGLLETWYVNDYDSFTVIHT